MLLRQVTYTFGSATRARFSASPPAAPNQDAYLTFPTFLAAEQALVGVMNGHGPQGEQRAGPPQRPCNTAFAQLQTSGTQPPYDREECLTRAGRAGATLLGNLADNILGSPAGHAVAQHVKARLPVDLVNQLLRSAAPADALRAGFAATQAGLAAAPPKAPGAALIAAQCPNSGCTATVVLLREAALAAAWVGNSRAVLALREAPGPGGLAPRAVTRDHVLAAGCGGCGARMLRTAGSGGRRIVRRVPVVKVFETMTSIAGMLRQQVVVLHRI